MLDADGQPRLADAPAPAEPMRVLACGLCGSDVEKIGVAPAGTVLGHEVVARRGGRRARRADPPPPLRRVRALPRRPRVDLRRVRARRRSSPAASPRRSRPPTGSSCRTPSTTRSAPTSSRSPACSAARSACRAAACSSSARASSAGCSRRCCGRAATSVYATDARAERAGRAPDGPVDAAVLCAPAAPLDAVAPGGTVLVFSPAAPVDLDLVYRNELTLTGSRSATPRHMRAALELLPTLDLPEPTVLPLDRFEDGLDLLPLRPRAQGRVHAVRALRFHGPGDLRLEEVPNPEPGPGDVLVQVEVALTDGTDLKTFRRGHPVLLRELPSPFGHEFCGIDVATGRARRRRELGGGRRARRADRAPERRLRRAAARAGGDRAGQPPARAGRARARGGGDGRAARLLPARRRAGRESSRATGSRSSAPGRSA